MTFSPTTDTAACTSKVTLGTRRSKLALIQCCWVQNALRAIAPSLRVEVQDVLVKGDADKTTPFLLMEDDPATTPATRDQLATNFWTSELEAELLAGHLDVLVHCLEDLPTTLSPGTMIGAILERRDPRDVLVVRKGALYKSLADMPDGSVVGTSSLRRKSLVRLLYPKLKVDECRGNL
jgi:hydroxymethylbilane synthase